MATAQPLSFGALLRRYRRAAGFTQDELASRAGYSADYIGRVERGERVPVQATVTLLAEALELSPAEQLDLLRMRNGAARAGGNPARGHSSSTSSASTIQTFMFADIRGYTRFTSEHGDEAAAQLAGAFVALAQEAVESRRGRVVAVRGDELLAVFASARQAMHAAVEAQQAFAAATERDPAVPLTVGIGLDAGEAVAVDDNYRGAALNLASRLCAIAEPGEVLVSDGTAHLTGKVAGLVFEDRGLIPLKGIPTPVHVLRVVPEDKSPLVFPGTAATGEADAPLPVGGFLGARPSGPLVARDAELLQVLNAVAAVQGGSGRMVLLAGEPGIGKTRLAQEVSHALRGLGFIVGSGRCYEPEQTVAYFPFLEALATAYASAPPDLRAAAVRRWPDVVRLLPDQRQESPAPVTAASAAATTVGQDEQQRLFWSVTGFVQALAERRPVAFLLDDLHWADAASLALLQHLARHTRAAPVFLLGAYRDVEVQRQHPLEGALRSLGREQLVERIPVRRLSPEGTAALVAATIGGREVSDEFTTLLHQRTDGNPFFTQEVLRALVERGDLYHENGRWERRALDDIAVPESIRSAIGERVSRLNHGTQQILQEAGVLGQTFTFTDLQGICGRPESELETALEDAYLAGLIREMGRDGYSFNHALTQQALYADVSARRRRRLHRAAGEALERLPERVRERRIPELAWHFLQADDAERALSYALLAGRQAETVFGYAEAERYYRTALELARDLADRPREAEALERHGGVLRILLRFDDALAELHAALGIYREMDDGEGIGRGAALLGQVHADRGTPAEGIAQLQPLVAELAERDISPDVRAAATDALAQLYHLNGRYDEQLAAAEQAVQLARAGSDARLLAQAQMRRGNALRMLGRMTEATDVLEDTIQLAESAADPRQLAYALENVSVVYLLRGEFEKTSRYVERALALAERLGDPLLIELMTLRHGMNAFVSGGWFRARQDFERAAALMRQVGMSWVSMYCQLGMGIVQLAQGEETTALNNLRDAVEMAERGGDLQALRWAQSSLAEHDLLHGRPDVARARLEPLLDRPGQEEGMVTYLMPILAWAYLDLDLLDEARDIEAQCLARARAEGIRLAQVEGLRVRAMRELRGGDPLAARASLDESLALCRALTYPYGEIRALYTLAHLFAQAGETTTARERFDAALALCHTLGERLYAERIESVLASVP